MLAHIPLSLFLPPSLSAPPHAPPSPSALPAQPPKPTRTSTQTPKPIERTHYCGIRSKSSYAILVKPTLADPLTKTDKLTFFQKDNLLCLTLHNSLRPVLTSSELDRAKHNTIIQTPILPKRLTQVRLARSSRRVSVKDRACPSDMYQELYGQDPRKACWCLIPQNICVRFTSTIDTFPFSSTRLSLERLKYCFN
jgi:hypothetical protein